MAGVGRQCQELILVFSFRQSVDAFIQYPQHSAHEWRNFWKANIRPVHLKKQRALKSAEAKEPELVVDGNRTIQSETQRNDLHRTDAERKSTEVSLLLEGPKTPVLLNHPSPKKATVNSLAEGSVQSLEEDDLTIASTSPKRKRDDSEGELPRSSPPNPQQQTPFVKRRRVETGLPMQKEIPSTPERSPLSIRRHPPTPVQYNIIDIEDDELDIELAGADEDGDDEDLREQPASQSLSEPEQALAEMRDVFRDPRLLKDFAIAPSEGGWDNGELEIAETIRRREDTQGILQGQTPAFDFSVPEPEEGWDILMQPPPSSPPIPTNEAGDYVNVESPEELMDEEEMIAILEQWLDSRIESGINTEILGLALKSSSNDPNLADVVLESLDRHNEVPTDIRGIWTEEDDKCLEAVDARKINAMIEKHGQDGLDKRYDFLRRYNAN